MHGCRRTTAGLCFFGKADNGELKRWVILLIYVALLGESWFALSRWLSADVM